MKRREYDSKVLKHFSFRRAEIGGDIRQLPTWCLKYVAFQKYPEYFTLDVSTWKLRSIRNHFGVPEKRLEYLVGKKRIDISLSPFGTFLTLHERKKSKSTKEVI